MDKITRNTPLLRVVDDRFAFNKPAMELLGLYKDFGVDILKNVDGLLVTSKWMRFDVSITTAGGHFRSKPLMADLDIQGAYELTESDLDGFFTLKLI